MNRSNLSIALALALASWLGFSLPAGAQDASRTGARLRTLVASRSVITEEDLAASRPESPATARVPAPAEAASHAQAPALPEDNSSQTPPASDACRDLAELRRTNDFLTRSFKRLSALLEAAQTDLRHEIYSNARNRVEAQLAANQEEIDYILRGSEAECSSSSPAPSPAAESPAPGPEASPQGKDQGGGHAT